MQRKFWAHRNAKTAGPFATREQAVQAGFGLLPKRGLRGDTFYTGYGEFSGSFSIEYTSRDKLVQVRV